MKSAAILGLLASLTVFAPPAEAQQCPGSLLIYIVRDAKGAPVDAADSSLTFEWSAGTSPWARNQYANRGWAYDSFASLMPAELQKEVMGRIDPLSVGSMGISGCVFTKAVTLSVTMANKKMNLVFNAASRCCGSHSLRIDGLPFQEGRFEITPSVPDASPQHHFFPARSWRKISD